MAALEAAGHVRLARRLACDACDACDAAPRAPSAPSAAAAEADALPLSRETALPGDPVGAFGLRSEADEGVKGWMSVPDQPQKREGSVGIDVVRRHDPDARAVSENPRWRRSNHVHSVR